jgi:CheY-like chemotaxis protein
MRPHPRGPQSSRADRPAIVPRTRGTSVTHLAKRSSAHEVAGASVLREREAQAPIAEPQRPARILLVDADPVALSRLEADLSGEGYMVATAPSFQAAKQRFHAFSPDLLVAAIRLEAFNGLHLAAWVRFDHPNVPVIVIHTSHDPVLENDARRLAATFVVQPLENPGFLQHVHAAVGESHPAQAGVRSR